MGASQRGHRAGEGRVRAGTVRRWDPPGRRTMASGAPAADRPAECREGPLQCASTSAVAHGVFLRRRLSADLRPPELYLCAAAGVVSAGGCSALG
ncbi:hypothetical protein DV515_00004217, partial [Chloebia gouldiae]